MADPVVTNTTPTETLPTGVAPAPLPAITVVDHGVLTTENQPLTLNTSTSGLLSGDSAANGDGVHIINVMHGDNDIVRESITSFGSGIPAKIEWIYTPNSGFVGIDKFTATVGDDHGNTAIENVNANVEIDPLVPTTPSPLPAMENTLPEITATPVAAAPVTITTHEQTFPSVVTEHTPITLTTTMLLNGDTVSDASTGDSLSLLSIAPGTHSASSSGLKYVPDADYFGADTFTATVKDQHGDIAIENVNVTIAQAIQAPTNEGFGPVNAGSTFSFNLSQLGIHDLNGEALTLTGATTQNGTAKIDASNGQIDYVPAAGFHGSDAVTVAVKDVDGNVGTEVLHITVNAVPVVTTDNLTVNAGSSLTTSAATIIAGHVADADGNQLSVINLDGYVTPGYQYDDYLSHGSAHFAADGTIVYTPRDTPAQGTSISDKLTYTVSDGHGGTAIGTVNITINGIADNGVVVHEHDFITKTNAALLITQAQILNGDTAVNGGSVSIQNVTNGQDGTVVPVFDRLIGTSGYTYTPNTGFTGVDHFTVTVQDNHGNLASEIIGVTVMADIQPPVAKDDSFSLSQDTSIGIAASNLLLNDSDPNGFSLSVSGVGNPAHGAISFDDTTGDSTYTPAIGYFGPDSFTYNISDGQGGTASATVNLAVNQAGGGTANPVSAEAVHDFNGDQTSDVLFHNDSGAVSVWDISDGTFAGSTSSGGATTDWQIVGDGTFNGDVTSDILWLNKNGTALVWDVENNAVSGAHSLGTAPGTFAGAEGDNIFWQNSAGHIIQWDVPNNAVAATHDLGAVPTGAHVVAVGDFEGNGDNDLLFHNDTTGGVNLWDVSDGAVTAKVSLGSASTDWHIAGVGNFGSDGNTDILWHNNNGLVVDWDVSNNAVTASHVIGAASTDWSIAGVGDFEGNGDTDILWHHAGGSVVIWDIHDDQFVAAHAVGGAPTDWHIIA